MARVSVRTLHHYDVIGLLVPSRRTESNYRLYDDEALLRLQQIVIGRELGLPLEEIRRSLDDPKFDRRRALLDQRTQLKERVEQATLMIQAIDRALEQGQRQEQEGDMNEIFDGFTAEAEERWGDTDAYKESASRTKSYTKDDWERQREEQATICRDAAAAMQAGAKPEDIVAMDVAERHRLSIDRWFYSCSHKMHRGLADLYEEDDRFAQNLDRFAVGLTPFLAAAIRANAARVGVH